MKTIAFSNHITLPKEIGEVVTIKFKSLPFKFDVELARITTEVNGNSIFNVRLFVNKTFTNTVDVTESLILDKTPEFQRVVIGSVFNQRFTQVIIKNIRR